MIMDRDNLKRAVLSREDDVVFNVNHSAFEIFNIRDKGNVFRPSGSREDDVIVNVNHSAPSCEIFQYQR